MGTPINPFAVRFQADYRSRKVKGLERYEVSHILIFDAARKNA
jgi:hypothetical protein